MEGWNVIDAELADVLEDERLRKESRKIVIACSLCSREITNAERGVDKEGVQWDICNLCWPPWL